MAYTKTTWVTGDKVTSTKLNKIEQGIYDNDAACDELKTALTVLEPTATSADVGKALIAKTVADGKVTEYEFGEAGGGGASAIVNSVENVAIASFDDGAASAVKQLVVGIEPVQSGSGDPAPDNVRPITGWTGANVNVKGANVWDGEVELGMIDHATGDNSTSSNRVRSVNYIPVLPNTEYCYVRKDDLKNQITGRVCFYDINKEFISGNASFPGGASLYSSPITFTTPANAYYMRFSPADTYSDISINYPATDTSYHAYTGTTYEITFPVAAGTVYGGTLTNEGGEWKLRVDTVEYVVDGVNNYAQFSGVYCNIHPNDVLQGINTTPSTWKSNQFICSTYICGYNSSLQFLYFNQGGWSKIADNANDFNAYCQQHPIQFVIPLATPTEYTITGEVVETLRGVNNIWADTGNINLLEYFADSKTYIDEQNTLVKALIAPVLDSMVADTALTANDFRIVNNTLYRITTSVASGATLTPNTNCIATTIAEILKSLLS